MEHCRSPAISIQKGRLQYHCSCVSQDRMLQHVLDAVPHIRKVHAPTLSSILAEDSVHRCPYDVTFETPANYNIVTIHTSGTSGNPKPIGWNTRYLSKIDQGNDLPIPQGAPLAKTILWHENSLSLLPCFHVRSPTLFLPRDNRVLKAILSRRADFSYICRDI
jgi:hypothetical protein